MPRISPIPLGDRTAEFDTQPIEINWPHTSGHFIFDVTAVPASGAGVQFFLEGYEPSTQDYYPVISGVMVRNTGTYAYRVGPSLTAVANQVANDIVPYIIRVRIVHDLAGLSHTYAVGGTVE